MKALNVSRGAIRTVLASLDHECNTLKGINWMDSRYKDKQVLKQFRDAIQSVVSTMNQLPENIKSNELDGYKKTALNLIKTYATRLETYMNTNPVLKQVLDGYAEQIEALQSERSTATSTPASEIEAKEDYPANPPPPPPLSKEALAAMKQRMLDAKARLDKHSSAGGEQEITTDKKSPR